MTSDQFLDVATLTLIIAATVFAWTFCLLYAALSHGAWARSKEGRHLMVLTLGLALLGSVSLLRRLVGEWDVLGGYQLHVTLIYGVLAWQLFDRCRLLITNHRAGELARRAARSRLEK